METTPSNNNIMAHDGQDTETTCSLLRHVVKPTVTNRVNSRENVKGMDLPVVYLT